MTRNTIVKIDWILHATEDFQKIAEPLNELLGVEKKRNSKTEFIWTFWESNFYVTY